MARPSRRTSQRGQAQAQPQSQVQGQAQAAQAQPMPPTQPQATQTGGALQNQGNNRNVRNISGPQSALTDYLASHNISANQIRRDADQRRAAAAQSRQAQQDADEDEDGDEEEDEAGPSTETAATRNETAAEKAKRKQKEQQAIAKIKASKAFKKRKRNAADSEEEDEIARALFEQMAQPLPGQMDNCDICQKRFTVTPYSKKGPNGGLLCAKCSKDAAANDKNPNKKPRKATGGGARRRKMQSNILDGTYHIGAKPLITLCIETLAKNVDRSDSLDGTPDHIMDRIARLFSKRRLLNPHTLNLFLQPWTTMINIYDGAKLSADDYIRIFQVASSLEDFKARNAIQFKDEVMDYVLSRDKLELRSFYLYGANLVSDEMWSRFIKEKGGPLTGLRVYYTDKHFGDEILTLLPEYCPNLQRLKVYHNQKVTDDGIKTIGDIKSLKHLGIHVQSQITSRVMAPTILSIGEKLETLSLRMFYNADDKVLAAIKKSCRSLRKLRITDSDKMTDEGFTDLFSGWKNPPLHKIDFEKCRHLDSTHPRDNLDGIGLCSNGFRALMKHSGRRIRDLNLHACRHITRQAFEDVFSEGQRYPDLVKLEISFIEEVDDFVVASVFRSCPNIREVNVFGCMNVKAVKVPRGKVLVGVPNAMGMVIEGDD
ncbi:DNA repair protein [Colletotrichum musicola]|uniref:DNA repair protein n=1 Tax=Colletotrichum musicola TaxID=2175873 RepID=A0A8H6NYN1_9PEZI|nr:DNA repair protein [Colletotrichum musicola]